MSSLDTTESTTFVIGERGVEAKWALKMQTPKLRTWRGRTRIEGPTHSVRTRSKARSLPGAPNHSRPMEFRPVWSSERCIARCVLCTFRWSRRHVRQRMGSFRGYACRMKSSSPGCWKSRHSDHILHPHPLHHCHKLVPHFHAPQRPTSTQKSQKSFLKTFRPWS